MGVLIGLIAVLVLVVVLALVDLVNAIEMEPTGRIILAGALLLLPPVGLLAWLVVRMGRAGVLVATGLVALVAVLGISVAQGASFSPLIHSVTQQGFSVSVPVR